MGQKALATRDLDGFFEDACVSLCSALECDFAKMLKLSEDKQSFIGVAGAGWDEGALESSKIDAGRQSQAGYTLLEDHSVLTDDLAHETRFDVSGLLSDHAVRSGIGALITVGAKPWGVISLHDRAPSAFGPEDLAILESVSNIIAMTIMQSMREDFLTQERLIQSLSLGVAEIGVWTRDLATGETTWDQRLREIVGVQSAEVTPRNADLADFIIEEDRQRVRDGLVATAEHGQAFEEEYRLLRPDGETIWLHTRAERTIQNNRSLVIGITVDITERKHSEERSEFMMRELDHRVKNLLAIILSIAEITARSAPDVHTYKGGFRSRLEAIARTHSLLADARWSGVELRSLIEDEVVGKAAEGAVTIDGPEVPISPSAAQSLAMLFHELNTNAHKYGSLSVPGGKLQVLWYKLGGDDGEVVITWVESGGPPVSEPSHLGFGSKVINQIIRRQFSATLNTEWDPSGMSLSLRLPGASIRPTSQEAPASVEDEDEDFVSKEPLSDARVLVADHEWLAAEQFAAVFASLGADIVGPFLALEEARAVELEGIDIAILDLGFGEEVLTFAEQLEDKGIGIVFVVEPGASIPLPGRFVDAPVLSKPASADVLIRSAARLLG
ncbi:MAG: HWE histidine kinase domain-containing protein [Pseudomonadota bacterium]